MFANHYRLFRKSHFVAVGSFAALLMGCSASNDDISSAPPSEPTPAAATPSDPADQSVQFEKPLLDPNAAVSEVAAVEPVAAASEAPESPVTPAVAAAPAATVEPTTPESAAVPKSKRDPIYIEEANGKELIAAALKKAQRDHKHVLIEWGGNWCGWCFKLHDVFHNDPVVHPIVHEEFELVLIDQGENRDLMLEYGGKDRQYSFPHLTVLNSSGEVLTNQETGSLEEGPKHDPKLVSEFLTKWVPAEVDAEQLLATSLQQATAEGKRVFLRVGTPYCGWCNVLSQFLQDHESLFATDYVNVKIDTMRMNNGTEVAARYEPKQAGGIPWFVILDANGKELASSTGPEGNIGHPYQPSEIAHFLTMLKSTRQKLTDAELETISADLNAYRESRELKSN